MRPSGTHTPLIIFTSLALATAAVAAPAVVVVGVDSAGAEAQAFARGAREMAAQPREAAEAADALRRAEQAFLELDFAAAERDLTTAVQFDLSTPERAIESQRAFESAIRLAQVLLARKRPSAADRLLAQAVATWPGFPGGEAPPPDVKRRLVRARRRQRMTQSLQIGSRPQGLVARYNGVAVGRTPVKVEGLVAGPQVVCVEGRLDARCQSVDVGSAPSLTLRAEPPAARGSLAESVAAKDAERGWSALADLESSLAADYACVAQVEGDSVLVARLAGRRRTVLGGRRAPRPGGISGWAVLGRLCGPEAPSDRAPSQVVQALWGAPPAAAVWPKKTWGWASVGAGVAVAGLGVGLGLAANGAEDAYQRRGDEADADAARGYALGADISFVSAAVLTGVGIALFLWD